MSSSIGSRGIVSAARADAAGCCGDGGGLGRRAARLTVGVGCARGVGCRCDVECVCGVGRARGWLRSGGDCLRAGGNGPDAIG